MKNAAHALGVCRVDYLQGFDDSSCACAQGSHGQPVKKQVRKSKKSWLLVWPLMLKSALLLKKPVRKSKKSCELSTASWFQSQLQTKQGERVRVTGPTAPL